MYEFPAGPDLPPEMMQQEMMQKGAVSQQPIPQMGNPGIPPEMIQAIVGLGSSTDKRALIHRQLELANALRGRQAPGIAYQTGPGAAFAGLGNMLNQYNAGQREKDLMQQEKTLMSSENDQRQQYAKLLMESLRRNQGSQPSDILETTEF